MKDINEYKDDNHDVLTYKGKDYLITKKISYLLRDKIGNTNLSFYVHYPKFVYDCIDSFNMGVYSGPINDEFIDKLERRCERFEFETYEDYIYTLEKSLKELNNKPRSHTLSGFYAYQYSNNYILRISYDIKTGITRIYDDTIYPIKNKKN